MHVFILAAVSQAAQSSRPSALNAAIIALIVAAVAVSLLKIAGKILSPKKKTARSSSPYASTRK